MKRLLIVLPAMMALAGCGSEPDYKAENASVAEVTKATQDAIKLQPGKWETRVAILSVEGDGVPPQMVQTMKQAGGQTVETCVTPEMAARPPQDLLGMAKSCTYEDFEMTGGNMKGTMTCGQDPANPNVGMRATMEGKFTSTSYDVTSEGTVNLVNMPGSETPGGKVTTKTQVTGKRVGECDGAAAKAG